MNADQKLQGAANTFKKTTLWIQLNFSLQVENCLNPKRIQKCRSMNLCEQKPINFLLALDSFSRTKYQTFFFFFSFSSQDCNLLATSWTQEILKQSSWNCCFSYSACTLTPYFEVLQKWSSNNYHTDTDNLGTQKKVKPSVYITWSIYQQNIVHPPNAWNFASV